MSTNSLCFLTVLSEMCVKSANLKVCSHWQLEVAPSALLLVDCMSSSLTSLSILLWGGYSCYTGSCHIVSLCIYIKLNSFVALPNAVSNSHSNWMILVALSANQCQYKCTLWKQFITFFFGLFPTMGIVDFLKLSLKTLHNFNSLFNLSTNNVQQLISSRWKCFPHISNDVLCLTAYCDWNDSDANETFKSIFGIKWQNRLSSGKFHRI